jgi:hypothetical protein
MNERRPIGWYLGLILIAMAAIATAAVLTWIASDMQIRVNEFYSSNPGGLFDEGEYREWDTISMNSYTLLTLVTPLLTGGGIAVIAMLAVLAYRWEQRRAAGQPVAEEETAAS